MHPGKKKTDPGGVVLLIDEIDKANPDLPNGLLETLADLTFRPPYLDTEVSGEAHRLLVIFTTNKVRDLPDAFVRRCFVPNLRMDDSVETRKQWLIDRGRLHFDQSQLSDKSLEKAASMLWEDRSGMSEHEYRPGLAEYLDLISDLGCGYGSPEICTQGHCPICIAEKARQ